MQAFVLDCSVTMTWLFTDEITIYTEAILNSLTKKTAYVPWIWSLEVSNVLLFAEKKKRITHVQATTFKQSLEKLSIITTQINNDIYEIAREFNLSAYDACYLALALEKNIPIATLDKALISAAENSLIGLVK